MTTPTTKPTPQYAPNDLRHPVQFARVTREMLASNGHFFEFKNIPAEWARYQAWRQKQGTTLPSTYTTWPQVYLTELNHFALRYQDDLNQNANNSDKGQEYAEALQPFIIQANLLLPIYRMGTRQREVDPQDETAFRSAFETIINAAQDTSRVQNLDQLPANAVRPAGPIPDAPKEDWWDRYHSPDPEFIGAKAQVPIAQQAGFYFKKFSNLAKEIPEPAPGTVGGEETDSTSTLPSRVTAAVTRRRRGPRGTTTTETTTPTTPYDIAAEIEANPRPARINFQEFGYERHPEEYSDEFFITLYRVLYDRVADFGLKWFGDIDLPSTYVGSPWQEDLGEQFVEYTRLVAHEDRLDGGWNSFLTHAKYRKWLIVGILGQIIQKKVFSELLFGASPEWQTELDSEDLRFIEVEGYRRKSRRSETVKMSLRGALVPPRFWGMVDDFTWRTCFIFEPLINLLDLYRPVDGDHQTDLRHFYQELHAIFSLAGYVQVCTAIDPSVFHHLSATPGARMDYPIEAQAEIALYRDSKETNETLDAQWEEAQEQLANGQAVNATDLAKFNDLYPLPLPPNTAGSPHTSQATYDKAKRVASHHRLRGARIKIAVFPMLKRYTPMNRGLLPPPELDEDQYVEGHPKNTKATQTRSQWYDVEGQRIADIFRCTVIYYQGLMYPANPLDDGIPLDTFLTDVRGKERLTEHFSWAAKIGAFVALVLVFLSVLYLGHVMSEGVDAANEWVVSYTDSIPYPSLYYAIKQVWIDADRNLLKLFCHFFCYYIYWGRCYCQ